MYYRQDVDRDGEQEMCAISEQAARGLLNATYRDVDIAVEFLQRNGRIRTVFGFLIYTEEPIAVSEGVTNDF